MPLAYKVVYSSEWLCNLPTLRLPSYGVLELLPADGIHLIALFAGSHDDAQLVACGAEVVGGLVTKGNLPYVEVSESMQYRGPAGSRFDVEKRGRYTV